jgi:hypothetical protein
MQRPAGPLPRPPLAARELTCSACSSARSVHPILIASSLTRRCRCVIGKVRHRRSRNTPDLRPRPLPNTPTLVGSDGSTRVRPWPVSAKGHGDQFPRPRPNGRPRIRKRSAAVEIAGEAQCGFRCDCSLAADYLADSRSRQPQSQCQRMSRDAARLQLVFEHLARVRCGSGQRPGSGDCHVAIFVNDNPRSPRSRRMRPGIRK